MPLNLNTNFLNTSDSLFLLEVGADDRFLTLDANPAFVRMIGIPREELVGAFIDDTVPEELATQVTATCRRCLEVGSVVEETLDLDLPQGQHSFHSILIPLRDATGRMHQIIGIASDLTTRRQAPKHCLAHVNLALEHVREPVFLLSETAEFIFVNDAVCRSLGYDRAELLGLTVADIDPDFPVRRWPGLWKKLTVKGPLHYESRHRTKDGRTFPVEVHVNTFLSGGRGYAVAVARDTSDRHQALQVLRESEERFRSIVVHSPDTVSYQDRELRYTMVFNPAIPLLSGLIIGRTDWDLLPPAEAERLTAIKQRVLQSGVKFQGELSGSHAGQPYCIETTIQPLHNPDGERVGICTYGHDITKRKRAEEERQANLSFLEGMDKINRALQKTSDLETMMSAVLDTVLDLFDCDRAFLMFPCDPKSATWMVPMERTRPEWPGALALKLELTMDPDMAEALRLLLAADGPLAFGPGPGQHPLPAEVSARVGIKSCLLMAISPLIGKPWQFGVHQCSYARLWTGEDKRLLQEIGRRLADAMGALLACRDLRESESMHRSLVASMAEGVVFQAADGSIIAVNPAAEKILGLTAPEMRGQTSADLDYRTIIEDGSPFPAEQHPAMLTLRTGEPQVDVTMGIRKADGVVTWISINSQPLTTPGTSLPYAVVTTFHDITGRKQAEDRVRQREREFRTLAETLPANVARYDRDGRMIYVNRALAEFLGVTYDEHLIDGEISRPIPEANRQFAEYRQTLRRVIATGQGTEMELDLPDRKAVHLIRFSPERDASGQIVGALTIGRDITEYKRTQIRLKKQADDLTETNSALKVLLQHSQQAESEIQKKCLANIEALVLPYLDQLESPALGPEGRICLDVIRKNLQGLAVSSMCKLTTPILGLTPREVVVADMIRKDHTSKDIADFLCLSPGTIEFFRDQIRTKLGIKHQKVNLKNYLRNHFND